MASTERQRKIYAAWDAIEDVEPDISTERLFAMVSNECRADNGEIAEALLVVGRERGTVTE